MSDVYTQSALRAFQKCPRLYQIRYQQLVRPARDSQPIVFGSRWHEAREVYWNRGAASAVDYIASLEEDEDLVVKLMVMLKGYHERWGDWLKSVDIIAVEQKFEHRIWADHTFTGKIDAIIRENGKLWVVEEKTTAQNVEPGSPFVASLACNMQASAYHAALSKQFGERVEGTKWMVNVKPKLNRYEATPVESRKYTKEGRLYANQREEDESIEEFAERLSNEVKSKLEHYYRMFEVPRLDHELRESNFDAIATVQAIRNSSFPRNTDACIHAFGGTCEFFEYCMGRASLDDHTLFRKATSAHEELEEK